MKISVALCTFNGERYLIEQIDSILNQSYPIDELIICDDSSTDATLEIIKNYRIKNPEIIKLHTSHKPLGTIKNFEKALSLCTGDNIFLSDQDDIWLLHKVEYTLNFLRDSPHCEVVFTNALLMDQNNDIVNGTLWNKWEFNKKNRDRWRNNYFAFKDLLKNQNKITGATVCVKKDILKTLLPINVPLGYWHDAWIGLHAAGRNSLCFIEEALIYYRLHERQQVGICRSLGSEVVLKSNPEFVTVQHFQKSLLRLYPFKLIRIVIEGAIYKLKCSFLLLLKQISEK